MAKKKNMFPMSIAMEFERKFSDNNPDGYVRKPGDYTDPSNYKGKKVCFANWVDRGESPAAPDVNVISSSGAAFNSRGQGNPQYNWGTDTDGIWNDNAGNWPGANKSGNS